MIRVNDEEFELDGDIHLYEGKPFTGTSFEPNLKGGLLSEVEYLNGFPNGLVKYWYPNGRLKAEFTCARGLKHGKSTSWYSTGELESVSEYQHGIEMKFQEYKKDGECIIERDFTGNNVLSTLLARHKEVYEEWIKNA